MTIAEFKAQNNITSLPLWKSKTEGSTRMVGSVNGVQCITTQDYNPQEPTHVFTSQALDADSGDLQFNADGSPVMIHWLTNKEPREADVTL